MNWLGITVYAQSNLYSINRFTPVDGIASSDVSYLFQDSKSYLWIAHAAGISRYDGQFENYLFSGEARLGRAFCIVEENPERYWIGAEGGLFVFRGGELKHIRFNGQALAVYHIADDHRGGLWLCTSDGPAHINANELLQLQFKASIDINARIAPAWKKHFPLKHVTAKAAIDDSGAVFITDGVTVYSLTDSSVTPLWASSDRADPVTGLVAWKKDALYFSSLKTGLHCFANGKMSTISDDLQDGQALAVNNGQLYYYATKGIFKVDVISNRLDTAVLLPPKFWEWGSCVMQDNEQNFWIGTHEGVLHAKRKLFSDILQPNLPEFDDLFSMVELASGEILYGGNRGKVFKRSAEGKDFLLQQKIFDRAQITTMLEDEKGNVWFGSGYQGIALRRNGETEIYTMKDGLRDNTNLFFINTHSKEIYCGGDMGITRITSDPGGHIRFKNYFFQTGSTNYPVFYAGVEEQNGRLLCGGSFGLFELMNDSLQSVKLLNSSRRNYFVTDIKLDAQNNAWISTVGDGILLCSFEQDGSLKLQQQFVTNDRLSSTIYLNLLIDRNGVVWAAGHSGISRIEKTAAGEYFVSNFDQTHGYTHDSYYSIKMIEDKHGIIWVASTSGLSYFNPSDVNKFNHTLSVQLTSVPRQTKLSYSNNDLYFGFRSIYLTDPSTVSYAYRLKGVDSNWINAGRDRSVAFRNLAPGSYTFQVKATSNASDWSKPASFDFIIKPPLWMQWWFIFSCVAGLAILVFYIIKKREKKIKRQEAEKTELQKLKAVSYQYRLEIEQVTSFFATSISKQKSVDDILWDVAKNCISKLGFEDCVIYLKDVQRNVLVQKSAWGPKTSDEDKIINPIEIPVGKGIVGDVAKTGFATIVNDTSIDSRYIVDDARRDAEIAVPIIQAGEVIGVIDCEHSQKHFYSERHLQILITIASLCADRIDKVTAEQKTREKEIEVFKLNQDLATSQLTALRSQMNPHFIFNSLNSIAQLVASKQNEVGLEYLTKFSRLLRLVLEESSSNYISLKDEVKMLDLYLQLETLRFGSSFNYNIHIDDELDEEEVLLPTFLIHPVVENAIWHGLLHKQGERRLIIQFRQNTKDELHCIVKDNGIGIDAAISKKKNSLNGEVHASKGLQLVSGRLTLLQQQYGVHSFITTEDLKDGDNFNTGTKVTIQMPVIYE